jgi:hypothetical protein
MLERYGRVNGVMHCEVSMLIAELRAAAALDELVRENERLGLYETPAASEPKVGVSAPYYPAMPQAFADYMAQQMPPGTVISEPLWWAPRIWRTAMRLYAAPPAANNYHDAARAARHEGISAMSDTRHTPHLRDS